MDQDIVIDDELESETLLGEGKSSLMTRETSEDGFSRTKMNRPLSSKSKPGAVVSTMDVSCVCFFKHKNSFCCC